MLQYADEIVYTVTLRKDATTSIAEWTAVCPVAFPDSARMVEMRCVNIMTPLAHSEKDGQHLDVLLLSHGGARGVMEGADASRLVLGSLHYDLVHLTTRYYSKFVSRGAHIIPVPDANIWNMMLNTQTNGGYSVATLLSPMVIHLEFRVLA